MAARQEALRRRGRPVGRLALAVVGLAALALSGQVHAAAGRVTAAQLQRKIDDLVAYVRSQQKDDGSFGVGRTQWSTGQTALAVLALRAAGVPPDEPAVSRGAGFLVGQETGDRAVYEVALRAMALCETDPHRYLPQITEDADYLVRAQQPSGGWTYGLSGRTDNSNTQFAVLGLHAAATAGVPISPAVWERCRDYALARQCADGGWAYTEPSQKTYGSMTAAGVTTLFICDLWDHVNDARCGQYSNEAPLRAGLAWLARNFSVTENPGGGGEWKFYYLYGLERAGVILARRYFGNRDWYREGVEHLVADADDVVMAGEGNEWPFLKRCFQLLFLAKGNAPLVLHKAEWVGLWNERRCDARFLVQYVGDQIGRRLDWQIVPLTAPLDELMAAPVLYISGGSGAVWPPEAAQRIRQYVEAGGVVLAEAAGGSAEFDASFRQLMAEAFPGDALTPIPREHPLYFAYLNIPLASRPPLEAISGPCWVSVIYSRDGLSCPWDIAQFDHVNFQLGANVIAYVTGFEQLAGKLAARPYSLVSDEEAAERAGAFVVGQIAHGGQWRPHKTAWAKVLERLNQTSGVALHNRTVPVDLRSDSPFKAHMLYLTGVEGVDLSEAELAQLRLYLDRGGFLFAEAACGSGRFDVAFRRLMAELFPESPLTRMPVGHPLLATGERLDKVVYSAAVAQGGPPLEGPYLEMIQRAGRTVAVYSKYDLSSAVDGHACHQCPSVLEPSAGVLLGKITLYGLSQ